MIPGLVRGIYALYMEESTGKMNCVYVGMAPIGKNFRELEVDCWITLIASQSNGLIALFLKYGITYRISKLGNWRE